MSFAPKITPADARVDWKLPAHVVDRQIRACTPEPGAWTELDGVRLKLGPVALDAPIARARPGGPPDLAPGELQAGRQRCSSAPAPGRSAWATSRPRASAA